MPSHDNSGDHRETHRRSGALTAAVMMLGSTYCDVLLGVVRGIIVMNTVGTAGRGIMRMVAIGHRYLTHGHLGIMHGISKELPQALGRGDTEAADRIEAVGSTYVMLTAVVCGLGMAMFGWFSHYGTPTRLSLVAGGGILVAQQTYALYRSVIRAWGRFQVLFGAGLTNTVGEFILIIVGAKLYGVVGAMLGWLLADALSVLYFRFASRFVVPVSLDWRAAYRLAVVGLPVGLIILADTLLRTVDGILVAARFDMHRLGLYSVAMQMATYLNSIPEAGGFVIMPRLLETYAADGDTGRLRRQVMLPTVAAACLMPFAAGCAFILLPPMVTAVVPKFVGCIFAAQALSLASVMLSLPVAANGLLIALNREAVVVINKCLGAAVIYAMATWQIGHGGGLRSVAVAAAAGYLVSSILSLGYVFSRYFESRWELLTRLALCYAPFAWSLGALKITGWVTRSALDPLGSDWWRALIRLALFVALMLPVLLYGDARTGLLRRMVQVGSRVRQRMGWRTG